jgi:threonine synthase
MPTRGQMMAPRQRLVCSKCEESYPLDDLRWRCECGGALDIEHRPRFDQRRIDERAPTLWRYREALPIGVDITPVHLGEGFTPLLQGRVAGYPVWLKQDHIFPSGSFKDRGAAILISHAHSLGVQHVVEDSSGNAGASIAAYAARAGITCDIYVPEDTAPAKLAQIRAYGAQLHAVPGDRQAATLAAQEAAETSYYASHVWNPFFLHGVKTFAFEVWEQMGRRAPDAVVLPVGNGSLMLGAAIGFQELLAAHKIHQMPRLIGVQARACAPLATAFEQGASVPTPVTPEPTRAEGIAIAAPARGEQILAAVRDSGGLFVTVTEDEIVAATRAWWRHGFAMEPTAGATLAGLTRYIAGSTRSREIIVSSITGHGLKASAALPELFRERDS